MDRRANLRRRVEGRRSKWYGRPMTDAVFPLMTVDEVLVVASAPDRAWVKAERAAALLAAPNDIGRHLFGEA